MGTAVFSNDKKEIMAKTSESVQSGKINSIMEGTVLEGEIRTDSNLRIDGKIKGSIQARGRLIVGQTGVIEGDVVCQSSEIEGTLMGKVQCQDLLSLKATAKVQGDIISKKLSIEPGAVFTGNCTMGGGVVKEMPKSTGQSQSAVGGKDQPHVKNG